MLDILKYAAIGSLIVFVGSVLLYLIVRVAVLAALMSYYDAKVGYLKRLARGIFKKAGGNDDEKAKVSN